MFFAVTMCNLPGQGGVCEPLVALFPPVFQAIEGTPGDRARIDPDGTIPETIVPVAKVEQDGVARS